MTQPKYKLRTGMNLGDVIDERMKPSTATVHEIITSSGSPLSTALPDDEGPHVPDEFTPIDAPFITVTNDSDLTGERALVAGTDLTAVDAGANSTLTLNHDNTAVTPGSYTLANITVNQRGHITAASNGSAPTHNLLSATHADTVAAAAVLGGMLYANATPAWQQLAGNTTTEPLMLTQTGTGGGTPVSAAPAWGRYLWQLDLRADGTMTEANPAANKTRLFSNHTGGRLYTLDSSGNKHDNSVRSQTFYFAQGNNGNAGVQSTECNICYGYTACPENSPTYESDLPSGAGYADPVISNVHGVTASTSWGGAPTASLADAYSNLYWSARWDYRNVTLYQAQVVFVVPVDKVGKTCRATIRMRRDPSLDTNNWNTDSFKLFWGDADGNPITAFTFSSAAYFTPTTTMTDFVSDEADISGVGSASITLILQIQGKNWSASTKDATSTHSVDLSYIALDQWSK